MGLKWVTSAVKGQLVSPDLKGSLQGGEVALPTPTYVQVTAQRTSPCTPAYPAPPVKPARPWPQGSVLGGDAGKKEAHPRSLYTIISEIRDTVIEILKEKHHGGHMEQSVMSVDGSPVGPSGMAGAGGRRAGALGVGVPGEAGVR